MSTQIHINIPLAHATGGAAKYILTLTRTSKSSLNVVSHTIANLEEDAMSVSLFACKVLAICLDDRELKFAQFGLSCRVHDFGQETIRR